MTGHNGTFEEIEGGITAAQGFTAAGVHCGVKKAKKDLAVICSATPATCAALFTLNNVPAAPVLVDRQLVGRGGTFRAVAVNSGNANACTGERGMADAWSMVHAATEALALNANEVLISSTGVIGQFLPIDRITSGIAGAATNLSREGHADAAEAILTTDTFVKEVAVRLSLGGTEVHIGGMAKGSGMIMPNMATMLAFITTDARIASGPLRCALKQATDRSFNRISVDGDTSTNDMVVVLANGAAGNPGITGEEGPAYAAFSQALEHVLVRLSKMIVLDGEGATKFVEIQVRGAATEVAAVQAARAIANSNLVKTAIHGEDANWGRILAAVGASGIDFDPAEAEISIGCLPLLRRNYLIDFSEEEAKAILRRREITIVVDLHQGKSAATFWTCDLSKEYIAINANYRT